MTVPEILQSVQFITVKGQKLAVLSGDDWDALIQWLETIEDLEVAQQAFKSLQAAEGDREKAGWLKWDEAREHLP